MSSPVVERQRCRFINRSVRKERLERRERVGFCRPRFREEVLETETNRRDAFTLSHPALVCAGERRFGWEMLDQTGEPSDTEPFCAEARFAEIEAVEPLEVGFERTPARREAREGPGTFPSSAYAWTRSSRSAA